MKKQNKQQPGWIQYDTIRTLTEFQRVYGQLLTSPIL